MRWPTLERSARWILDAECIACSQPGHLQTDVVEAQSTDLVHNGYESFQHNHTVSSDDDQGLSRMWRQHRRQPLPRDRFVIHKEFTIGREGDDDGNIVAVSSLLGLGQIYRYLPRLNERRRSQNDHQEHQHHVDQRNDVYLIYL